MDKTWILTHPEAKLFSSWVCGAKQVVCFQHTTWGKRKTCIPIPKGRIRKNIGMMSSKQAETCRSQVHWILSLQYYPFQFSVPSSEPPGQRRCVLAQYGETALPSETKEVPSSGTKDEAAQFWLVTGIGSPNHSRTTSQVISLKYSTFKYVCLSSSDL